jgi:hypothetical protein
MTCSKEFEFPTVRDSFYSFFERLTSELQSVPRDRFPKHLEMSVERSEGNRDAHRTYTADYQTLVAQTAEDWVQWKEFEAAVEEFGTHELFERLPIGIGSMEHPKIMRRNVMPDFAADLYNEIGRVELSEIEFDVVYKRFEEILLEDEFDIKIWAPLRNFRMETSHLQLGDSLTIREITAKERERLFQSRQTGRSAGFSIDFVIELSDSISSSPDASVSIHEYGERIKKVTTAIRLFTEGRFIHYTRLLMDPKTSSYSAFRGMSSDSEFPKEIAGKGYTFSLEEAEDLKDFWQQFDASVDWDDDELLKPIRRFNQMHSTNERDDQLINSIIGFEETLLKGASGGKFELASRATVLLDDEMDSQLVFEFFSELYDVRNGIVHRDKEVGTQNIAGEELHAGEFVHKARYFLGRVIHRYMEKRGDELVNVTEVNRDFLRPAIVHRLQKD